MNCKFCNAEMEEGVSICPDCGRDNAKALAEEKESAVVVMTKTQLVQMIIGVAAAVALLAALAVVLIGGIKFDWAKQDKKPANNKPSVSDKDNTDGEDVFVPFDNGVSYTVSDEDAVNAASAVVATMNGQTLTNGGLRLYYYMQVTNFVNDNYNYLSQMNLDYTKPLDQQQCYYDETLTWQQYFVNQAIETWKNYQGIYLMAVESGFKPDTELQAELDALEKDMEEQVKAEGYASGEEWIQDLVGTGCTMQDFLDYSRLYYIGAAYTDIDPTADQLEKYFAEHEEDFAESGITKDSGPMVDVRHILICPEEDSDAAWADCLKRAEDVLAQWKAGKATEESFAELANTLSEDGGSNTTGGLYAGVTADTNFVEPFLNWCMDKSRKVGDTDIVQTEHGYHIMYFSRTQQIWEYYAEVYFISENTTALIKEAKEKFPAELTLDNVKLAELSYAAS